MYATGTATDYADLLVRLQQFLTADLSAPERWTALRWFGWRDLLASSQADNFEVDRGFDASSATEWSSAEFAAYPSHVGVVLVTPLDLRSYAVTGSATPAYSPTAWDVEYSATGSTWTTLESVSGLTWSAGERKVFAVAAASPGAKGYWRLRFTAGGSSQWARVQRVELLETVSGAVRNHGGAATLYVQGPGTPGAGQPFVGLQLYRSTTLDVYNWRSVVADGHNPAAALTAQPGTSGTRGTCLANAPIVYHLAGNGRQFRLVAQLGSVWETLIAGLHLRRRTPGQYPYPALLIASLTSDALTRYSDTSRVSGWKGSRANGLIKDPANAWRQPGIWPYEGTITRRDCGGDYPLLPLVLSDSAGIYGEVEGVFHVSGFSNAAGNTATISGTDYLVVPDIARSGLMDYCAVRLD